MVRKQMNRKQMNIVQAKVVSSLHFLRERKKNPMRVFMCVCELKKYFNCIHMMNYQPWCVSGKVDI